MIFVDGSNLHWGMKGYNMDNCTLLRIDYKRLVNFLLKQRALVRAIYYCSTPVPPRPRQIKFLDYLRHLGIQVVDKPLKPRMDAYMDKMRFVEKGLDVALATDFIGMAWENAFDTAVLASGDADYAGTVSRVMSKGKNVEVVAFKKNLSPELRNVALSITILDDYIQEFTSEKVINTGTPTNQGVSPAAL